MCRNSRDAKIAYGDHSNEGQILSGTYIIYGTIPYQASSTNILSTQAFVLAVQFSTGATSTAAGGCIV